MICVTVPVMGARLTIGWRHRFRALLEKVRPRRLEFGVELLMGRAHALAEREDVPLLEALLRVYEFTRARVQRRLEKTGQCWVDVTDGRDAFACDASLGGLVRWLHAAGFEAETVADPLARARASTVCALTTDSDVLDRNEVRRRETALLWLPSGLAPARQLGLVLRDLGLVPRAPRCMPCGGTLEPVAKDAVRDRIPPRTARWKDDYFLCTRCDRLFWQGTHWERIGDGIRMASAL